MNTCTNYNLLNCYLSVMAKIKALPKPQVSFTFTSDQIEGVCFSIGELLIFHLPQNISSVSELESNVLSDHI